MAYGAKWIHQFDDIEGELYKTTVLERDYAGAATELTFGGGSPVVIETVDDASYNPFEPLRRQKATFTWICEDENQFSISELFITDDTKYKVTLEKYNQSTEIWEPEWNGFITFSDCKEPFSSTPYEVQFNAVCGLVLIKDNEFLDTNGKYYTGEKSLRDVIQRCLYITGDQNFDSFLELHESNEFFVSRAEFAYIDTDGLRGLKSVEVLEGILNAWNAYITQVKGKWVIKGIREQASVNGIRTEFSFTPVETTEAQVVQIGKGETFDLPYIQPTSDVTESLANPKSIINQTVQPGIPVNRLINGDFHSFVGMTPTNWISEGVAPYGMGVEGDGTPDSPYRYFMRAYGSEPLQAPTPRITATIIEINCGNIEKPETLKMIFSGIIKSADMSATNITISINEGERNWKQVEWLMADGKWQKSSNKNVDTLDISCNPKTRTINGGGSSDGQWDSLPEQYFEIESDFIRNLLNRPEGWIGKIKLKIWAGESLGAESGGGGTTLTPESVMFFSDLAITFTTNLPYEGDHTYQIVADDVINNGEEYTYATIVADKININTVEQGRNANRVMTGYLTNADTTLMLGWKRYINGVPDPSNNIYEPLQYKSLRERIRQLCGKRRIIEGTFYGYGLTPDKSAVVEYYESGSTPETFYYVSSYKWDVRERFYQARFNELRSDPLAGEKIQLVSNDSEGRRSRRSYGSGGAGGSSGGSGETVEPLVIVDPEIQYFVKGKSDVKILDLLPLVLSGQTREEIDIRDIYVPEGMIVLMSDLNVTLIWTPDRIYNDRVVFEASYSSADPILVTIPVSVRDNNTVTFHLKDDNDTNAGKLITGSPNSFVYTDPWGVDAVVSGSHDAIKWRVRGGNGTVDIDSGTDPIPVSGGIHPILSDVSYPAGIYNLDFDVYKEVGDSELIVTYSGTVIFNLSDPDAPEDINKRVKIELIDSTISSVLGEISQNNTIYETPESIDIAFTPTGIIYDELRATLFPEESPFLNTFNPVVSDITGVKSGNSISTVDGVATPVAGYESTDFIAVSEGDKIWYRGTTEDSEGIAGYNTDNVSGFVTGILDSNGDGTKLHDKTEIIIPAGVSYIRASSATSGLLVESVIEDNFLLFDSTVSKPSGDYSVFVRAYLSGVQVYEKFGQFTLLEAPPEEIIPVAGLQYVADPSINVPIPLTGGVLTLPVSGGFKLISNLTGVEYDGIQVASYEFSSTGVWTTIDLPMQLGFSPNKTFTTPRQSGTFQVFGGKSSLDVPGIHVVSSFHRVELTYTLAGETVAIVNGEWQFNPTAGLPDPTEPEPGEFILYWTEYEDF